jgi:UDP-3-O-[3-hydroxymyristoyl] glucosamine N-acyltransferase
VRVGAHTAIAGCAGVAGSADIGRHCTIGGGAVILGHLKLADRVNISAGTLISRSILEPGTYTGVFPFDVNAAWTRNAVWLRHLSELSDRVRELERLLGRTGKNG